MTPCGPPPRIDRIDLDAAARRYEAFLRSQRLLTGAVACLALLVLMVPLAVGSLYIVPIDDEPVPLWFVSLCTIGIMAFLGLLLYIYLYMFRAVMAGSRRVAWAMLVGVAVFLVPSTANLLLSDPAMTPQGPVAGTGGEGVLIRALLILYNLLPVIVLYLIAFGLLCAVRNRDPDLSSLFTDRNYDRRFWPGREVLLRNFWHMMGLSAPPRRGSMSARVTAAAVVALAAEGWSYYMYFGMNLTQFDKSLGRMATAGVRQGTVLVTLLLGLAVVFPVMVWIVLALSRCLRRYAQRRALLSADEARQVDPRRPVLFLRSFRDDRVSLAAARMPWLLRFFDPGSVAGTLDEMLTREFAWLGPVMTIGRPGDALPPLGAARKYCSGEEWQEVVVSLMDAAALIVVGVDSTLTQGLAWEIAQLRQHCLLDRTLFVLPPPPAVDRLLLAKLLWMAGRDGSRPALQPGQTVLSLCFPTPDRGLLAVSSRVTEVEYQLALRTPTIRERVAP